MKELQICVAGLRKNELPQSRQVRTPLRRRIDQLRVVLWFTMIQHSSQGATYYALEKQLVADGFGRNTDGALFHRHRMACYAKGKHVPRRDLVEVADACYPGSRAILDHVFWDILDPTRGFLKHRSHWLAKFGLNVQSALYGSEAVASELLPRRQKITSRLLHRLERLGSFDALAATVFLVREAQSEENVSLAFECARSFWVLLLLIGSSLPFSTFLPDLAILAGEALLDQICSDGKRVAIATAPIRSYEQLLRQHCLRQEVDGKLRRDWESWTRERLLFFRGRKGFDLLLALQLPTEAVDVSLPL